MMNFTSPGGAEPENRRGVHRKEIDMEIRNENDAKIAYEVIRLLQTEKPLPGAEERTKQHIVRLKKEVRAYNRFQAVNAGKRRIIKDNGMDGFIELVRLPVWLQTEEEAEAYFESNLLPGMSAADAAVR